VHLPDWIERPAHDRAVVAFVAAAAVVAFLAATGVAWIAGFGAVRFHLLHVDAVWFLLCFGAQPVAYACYAVTLHEFARRDHGPVLRPIEAIAAATVGFGAFLPRGGFALDYARLRRFGHAQTAARRRVLALGVVEYAVLAPAVWVCALVLVGHDRVHPSLTLPWLIGVPAGLVVAAAAIAFRGRDPRVSRIVEPLRLALLAGPLGFLGMAGYWTADIASLWGGLRVFGLHAGIAQTTLGFATGYVLTRRTLPLAGAGVTEALLAFALRWAALPLAPSLLGVVAYRLANVWLGVGPALAALPRLVPDEDTS
jgi:hypothetical protein